MEVVGGTWWVMEVVVDASGRCRVIMRGQVMRAKAIGDEGRAGRHLVPEKLKVAKWLPVAAVRVGADPPVVGSLVGVRPEEGDHDAKHERH